MLQKGGNILLRKETVNRIYCNGQTDVERYANHFTHSEADGLYEFFWNSNGRFPVCGY